MTAALLWVWEKARGYVLWIGAGAVLLITIIAEARRSGAYKERAKQNEKVDGVRRQWDAIDGDRTDFDAAVGRLRDRADRN